MSPQSHQCTIPTVEMTLYQRQHCGQLFKDQTIKGLNSLIKGTGWKRNSAWVFKVENEWYLTAFVTGGTTTDGMDNILRVELGIKPMAVDPIHWRAQGLHDNLKNPPSFRSNAAWKVPALPVAKQEWTEGLTDVEKASQTIFEAIVGMAETARRRIAFKPFSQLVTEHKEASRYSALRWASLIAEGQSACAIEEITAHYRGNAQDGQMNAAALDIIAGYQHVVDETDAPEIRKLTADIYGTQKSEVLTSRPLQKAETASSTLLQRLLDPLRNPRK
jgi:hypothetical protein